MYEIKMISELNDKQKFQASNIFVDGFYNIFSLSISKDKEKLRELLEPSFVSDKVYICLDNGIPIGFLGIGTIEGRALKLDLEVCQRILGNRRGRMLYKQMGAMVEKINVKDKDTVYIDYITVADTYRGKGVATFLFQYLFDNLPYRKQELDVLSKNLNAKRLYEHLGFKKVKTMFNPITFLFRLGLPILMKRDL